MMILTGTLPKYTLKYSLFETVSELPFTALSYAQPLLPMITTWCKAQGAFKGEPLWHEQPYHPVTWVLWTEIPRSEKFCTTGCVCAFRKGLLALGLDFLSRSLCAHFLASILGSAWSSPDHGPSWRLPDVLLPAPNPAPGQAWLPAGSELGLCALAGQCCSCSPHCWVLIRKPFRFSSCSGIRDWGSFIVVICCFYCC